jgi:hypothetical protein
MYRILIAVLHDITDIDRARAQAVWGRSTKKRKKIAAAVNTTNTSSIKYDSFNVFIIFTIIGSILLVLLIVATFLFVSEKSEERRDPSESNSLVHNSNFVSL